MKKRIIFVLIAVLAVSFSSAGYAGWKKIKKDAKDTVTNDSDKKDKKDKTDKTEKKGESKTAVIPSNVVLAKGLQISWCGRDVKDNGSVTISGLQGLTLPVKNGKFDLTLPANPVFGDEYQQSGFAELDFGSAKVYQFVIIYFENSNTNGSREETANGRGGLGFNIYYSDKDVKGTVNGEPVTLKKGWNIVGDKNELNASLMCTG